MSLPTDITVRIARILASGDRNAAGELAGRVAADIATGEATGFEAELAALKKLAGTATLGKRAPAASVVPGNLRGRYDVTMRKMQTAETPAELLNAKRDGEALLAELRVHAGIVAGLARPQRLGLI